MYNNEYWDDARRHVFGARHLLFVHLCIDDVLRFQSAKRRSIRVRNLYDVSSDDVSLMDHVHHGCNRDYIFLSIMYNERWNDARRHFSGTRDLFRVRFFIDTRNRRFNNTIQ
jgi:hypothetical protein